MHNLRYRRVALSDLDAIFDHISADNPRRATDLVEEIRGHCRTLCEHPFKGPARDDLRPGIRILPVKSRFVIAYRVSVRSVVILRIFYRGRNFEALLRTRG